MERMLHEAEAIKGKEEVFRIICARKSEIVDSRHKVKRLCPCEARAREEKGKKESASVRNSNDRFPVAGEGARTMYRDRTNWEKKTERLSSRRWKGTCPSDKEKALCGEAEGSANSG